MGDATRKVKAAGIEEIISTNSIPGITAQVDLAGLISAELKAVIDSKR
jgi:hypothetical protein